MRGWRQQHQSGSLKKNIRTVWNEEEEEWYFSIVDVIHVLIDIPDPGAYWRKLKQRFKTERDEFVTNCHGLKLLAADGKMRKTDVATVEQLLRLIQSAAIVNKIITRCSHEIISWLRTEFREAPAKTNPSLSIPVPTNI